MCIPNTQLITCGHPLYQIDPFNVKLHRMGSVPKVAFEENKN